MGDKAKGTVAAAAVAIILANTNADGKIDASPPSAEQPHQQQPKQDR